MNKVNCKWVLTFIIILQIIYTVYVFWNKKDGFMSDEVWSYGLSNSYYQPFFSLKDDVRVLHSKLSDAINNNQWISSRVLRDYITVKKGEQFTYDSVYYNNSYDVHPPLYYMMVHTICSLFPDSFSWWYGLGLNLLFLIGTQLFTYLTVKKITLSEWKALFTCGLYGAGKSALFTFIFIRQYALLVMLCMAFVYFSACIYDQLTMLGKMDNKTLVACATTALLTFLTHYHGICFIGVFTALQCIYFVLKKKWKQMFLYGGSIGVALGIFMAIWPYMFSHIFDYVEDDALCFSPPIQVRMLLYDLFRYNFGFTISIFPTIFWNVAIPLILAAIGAVIMFLFPFRKEKWFPVLIGKLKDSMKAFGVFLKRANYIPVFCFGAVTIIFAIVAHSVDVYLCGHLSMRYIFLTVPFLWMVGVIWLSAVLEKVISRKNVLIAMMTVLFGFLTIRGAMTTDYLFNYRMYGSAEKLEEALKGKNVLVVDAYSSDFLTNSVFMVPYLKDAEQVCFTSGMTLSYCTQSEEFDKTHVDYALVDSRCYELSQKDEKSLLVLLQGGDNMSDSGADEHIGENAEEEILMEGLLAQVQKEIDGLNESEKERQILGVFQGQMGQYYIFAYE